MGDYSSQITIEELDSGGKTRRTLTLTGSALPRMGAEWGMKTQVSTTWFQGYDEASQQTLGPREMPSAWGGEWHRTMLGRSPVRFLDDSGEGSLLAGKISDPHLLVDACEKIFRSGYRLRVIWSVRQEQGLNNPVPVQGRIVREGRCTEFKFRPSRLQDIDWDVTFEWAGRGPVTQQAALAQPRTQTVSLEQMSAALDAFRRLNNSLLFKSNASILNSANRFTLGQLEALADKPLAVVDSTLRQLTRAENDMLQVVRIGAKLASLPLAVANAVVNKARQTLSIANRARDELDRVPAELQTLKASVGATLRAYGHFAQSSEAAALVARRACDANAALRQAQHATSGGKLDALSASSSPTSVQRMYRTRAGDTPALISGREYGSPDHGVDILKANRLPWHTPTFTAGTVLVIPVLERHPGDF